MANHQNLTDLTSQFPTVPNPAQGSTPIGTPLLHTDALTNEDRATISQLAAEILDDPIALQHLCDHIYTLLQTDLFRQRTR
ncbi:hypothetical protein [Phormidium sp. FACHB-1136]|jgi:hypothetical protein|uniref:hypothetical protein n=1 Tax=Phormidium sp. FACHB-1136 TaxID=2692848 RepID=UPI0016839E4A|nr:hypothetical protein [Phormidium sp. FACHB-1136]MBD2426175.1 hypothetical protein [Phormidium sp. FACHB-1136]